MRPKSRTPMRLPKALCAAGRTASANPGRSENVGSGPAFFLLRKQFLGGQHRTARPKMSPLPFLRDARTRGPKSDIHGAVLFRRTADFLPNLRERTAAWSSLC